MKTFLFNALKDIRVIIFLFFLIRVFGLTNPPLEVAHNWRQTDMMMVSKNIAEKPSTFFYPRVDYEGAQSGIVGMEFPLVNGIIASFINTFGFQHWYGRLINLIISSFGIYIFYLIVLRLFDKRFAFTSAYILLASIWFAYSRKIMPDIIAVSFLFGGIYSAFCFFDKDKYKIAYLLLSMLLVALGGLVKISSFVVMAFLLPFILDKSISFKSKLLLSSSYLVSLSLIVFWYFVWVPHLNTLSGIRFFMGNSLSAGIAEIVDDASQTAMRFYKTALGYLGFLLLIIGSVLAFRKKETKLLTIVISGMLMQTILILKVGNHFGMHTYYILPFVPLMAIIAANAIRSLPSKYIVIIGLLFLMENSARYYSEFIIRTKNIPIENLAELLNSQQVPDNSLIAVNGNGSPTILYFSNRKGWNPSDSNLQSEAYMNKLIADGCEYIVICKSLYNDIPIDKYKKIYNDNTFDIYTLVK